MARWPVRCRHTACRHRRITTVHPDSAKKIVRCPKCGNRKGWRLEFQAVDSRELCDCKGPRHNPLRPVRHKLSHPMCDQNQDGPRNQLMREGVKEHELFDYLPIELLGRKIKQNEPCPF